MKLIKCLKCASSSVDEIVTGHKVSYKCHNCGAISSRAFMIDSRLKLGKDRDNELFHYSIGMIVKNQNKEILMSNRRFYPHHWSIIFEHVHNGEDAKKALARGLLEETNLKTEEVDFMFEDMVAYEYCSYGLLHHKLSVYQISTTGNDVVIPDSESEGLRWVKPSKIKETAQPLEHASKKVLERLKLLT